MDVGDTMSAVETIAADSDEAIVVTAEETFVPAATSKLISFTRLLTSDNGEQEITGVGFAPRLIVFLAGVVGGGSMGSLGVATEDGESQLINQDGLSISGSASVIVVGTAAAYAYCTITSLNADGFTLDWSKSGSPSGTAQITAVCFR